jgi:eukaryotic-like serine/threonine-protein kinase
LSAQQPAEPGEIIGGYRLDSILGRGGMGCVFLATHTKLGRKSAIKMLAPELVSQSEYVSRFLTEAKIVNDVRHPNIVDIHDFIELESPRRVAYVMELVEGGSLGSVIRKRQLTLRQAVNVSLQLVGALEAVHAVGVIHRDLKPENVLVVGDLESDLSTVPSIKVLDFGIAKSSSGDVSHKTVTGSMLGTPSYMAPEQIGAAPVSAATDVYAIGEIFYEMVSGQRLFRGDQVRLLSMKLLGELPELQIPESPAQSAIESLVHWCVEVDPAARPTLAQLANALTEILGMDAGSVAPKARPITADPEAAMTPANLASIAVTPARPLPLAWLGLGVSMAAIGAALAFWVHAQRAEIPIATALPIPVAQPAPVKVEAPVVPAKVELAPAAQPVEEPAAPAAKPKEATKRKAKIKTKPEATPGVVKKRELVPW